MKPRRNLQRMNEEKYSVLDNAICIHIETRSGHPTNSLALEQIARDLIDAGIGGSSPFPVAWRLIDRRIQAMKKSGRLSYEQPTQGSRRKWVVCKPASIPQPLKETT